MFASNKIQILGVNNYTGTTAGSFDVAITDKNGKAIGAGDSILFKQLLADGTYQTLGIVDKASVKRVSKVLKATAVPSYSVVTSIAGATDDLHRIEIAIDNYGSDSFEDQYIKQAHFKSTSASAVANGLGLVASAYENFSRDVPKLTTSITHPNVGYTTVSKKASFPAASTSGNFAFALDEGIGYVDDGAWTAIASGDTGTTDYKQNSLFEFFIGTTGKVYVVSKPQAFSVGKFQAKPLVYTVTGRVYDASDAYSETTLTVAHTGAVINPVDPKKIASLEWFCNGYKGDSYREVGYPNNFEYNPISATSTAYEAIYTIHYGDAGMGLNTGAVVDNTLHIACAANPATASTFADILEDSIYTAWAIDVRTTDA